jgi:hypothetical protein
VSLTADIERIAAHAATYAAPGERVTGVLVAEPAAGGRVYLCAFAAGVDETSWLALDADAVPVASRTVVREAASLAALCEVAEESAAGGRLKELRARLEELRRTEAPPGIEAAEEAAAALADTLESAPRVASTAYLDRIGAASRRLEVALGEDGASPFAAAVQQAMPAVDELTADVERTYKGPLA